jgi:hypothetical protein
MRPEPPDFDPMFQPGTRYRLPDPDGTVAVVEVHDAGLLHLPTGRVVACDPFWGSEVQRQGAPFTVTVPPGRYPVRVSIARTDPPDPGDPDLLRLGAAAKLIIHEEPVVAWELALQPGQDPAALAPDEIYYLGVDSGNASFLTPQRLPRWSRSASGASTVRRVSCARSASGSLPSFTGRLGPTWWWTRSLT